MLQQSAVQPEQKVNSMPQSPVKARMDPEPIAATHENASPETQPSQTQHVSQQKAVETNGRQYEPPVPAQNTAHAYEPQKERYDVQKEQCEPQKERYEPPNERIEIPKERYEAPKERYEAPKERQGTPKERYEAPKERYEMQRQPYEHQRQTHSYEARHRPIYDSHRYHGSPSHRTPSLEQQKALELANQRNQESLAHRMANRLCQEGQEITQYIAQPYLQGYRADEVTILNIIYPIYNVLYIKISN